MRDSKRDTDVQNSLLDSVGEGEGGMVWENGIETCILSYVKWITSPGSMHDTGRSELVHWDDPEGWDWEGGEAKNFPERPRLTRALLQSKGDRGDVWRSLCLSL